MNKKLQEFKYDIERATDETKVRSLIANYIVIDQAISDGEPLDIGESDECDCSQCTARNLKRRQLLEEQNNIAPLSDCDNDIEYLKKEELSESEVVARKFHVLFNKAEDDEKNKRCEGKKTLRADLDIMFGDYNERNREALNGLYGGGKYGDKKIKSPGVPVRDILECGTPQVSVTEAREVLRDALDNDSDFKYSYIANIKMFLYDRTGDLINDQDSYDLLDYILKE